MLMYGIFGKSILMFFELKVFVMLIVLVMFVILWLEKIMILMFLFRLDDVRFCLNLVNLLLIFLMWGYIE